MIRKAVIPAAGLGTRFLPVTKSQPKEMLPIVDKPTIQYVVEEAVAAGIRDILIITGRGKQSIENHFDRAFELEAHLEGKGHEEQLLEVRRLADIAEVHFIRQRDLNGLGDAISYARAHVGDEPFVVLNGDTVTTGAVPVTRQLIDVYNRYHAPVIGVERVSPDAIQRFGAVGGVEVETDTWQVNALVEKPRPGEAPSNLAIAARYVLTADIFDCIARTPRGKGNEIQLTDALRLLLADKPIYCHRYAGKRHDIGNRLEYMKTVVEFAADRPDIGADFRAFLREFVGDLQ